MVKIALLCTCILLCNYAQAFDLLQKDQVLNVLIKDYIDGLMSFHEPIKQAAKQLFYILCTISFVVSGINMIFENGSVQSFFAFFVKQILIIGLFWYLILNASQIGAAILDSFVQMPRQDNLASPASMLNYGIYIAGTVFERTEIELLNIPIALMICFFCLIFMLAIFVCVIYTIIYYITGYAICIAGVISLGFGALSFTRQIAINYIISLIACGIRLLGALIIIGTANNILAKIASALEDNNGKIAFEDGAMILFIGIFTLLLIKTVPDALANLVLQANFNFSMPTTNYAQKASVMSLRATTEAIKTLVRAK